MPPINHLRVHRHFFHLFALNLAHLNLHERLEPHALLCAIQDHLSPIDGNHTARDLHAQPQNSRMMSYLLSPPIPMDMVMENSCMKGPQQNQLISTQKSRNDSAVVPSDDMKEIKATP